MDKKEQLKYLKIIRDNLNPNFPHMCLAREDIDSLMLKSMGLKEAWTLLGHRTGGHWELSNYNSDKYHTDYEYEKAYHAELYAAKIQMINQLIKELES